jgi:hypothetical protein
MNHDSLFKMLLKNRSILRAFFEQFFPEAAKFIEFDKIEYVDKERVTLEGKKRTGDLLIKTSFRGKMAGFLIHLEHQAQRSSDLSWRMLEYFVLDRREYELPVYPIAVLSYPNSRRENCGHLVVDFPNKRVLDFDFDIIDLARLDARVFVQSRNPAALALTARMKFDAKERISLVRDFFLSLASSPVDRAEMALVAGFFSAYQHLDRREELQLQHELSILKPDQLREKVMQLTNPFIELGIRKGKEAGRFEGEVELVLRQLSLRLGALPTRQKKVIRKLDIEKIEALGESLLEFNSRADLVRWLKNNAS